ncbi:hypothetical protein [Streptomyces violaceusniger]|uniref:hypothetical protein n=1 Tax=Streptomyces violaceusniger TaxID=68280 RepID=UPI002072CA62|nr:hypothetical protein [Streptomyces violaceusniger]
MLPEADQRLPAGAELFAELQLVLTGGEQQYPLQTPHGRYRLDMLFPADHDQGVVVEFDGSYWHRDAEERDRLKADAVERHRPDWMVVRVREEPLRPTRHRDVVVPYLADPFTAASVVLEHLMRLTSWPDDTRQRARAYLKGGRRLGAALAQRLINERQSAAPPAGDRSAPQPARSGSRACSPPRGEGAAGEAGLGAGQLGREVPLQGERPHRGRPRARPAAGPVS